MRWTVELARAIASMMSLVVIWTLLSLVFRRLRGPSPKPELPKGFRVPMIALELAESPGEVKKILGRPDGDAREKMRGKLKPDFVFIAAYWLLFIALSALLAQRGLLGVWTAAFAAICATAAAQVDFLENLRLYALLETPPDADEDQQKRRVNDVREASRFKWGLSFAATALLAWVFLWRNAWWLNGLGGLYVFAAAVGFVGLRWYRPAVEWGFFLMILGVVLTALAFVLAPRAFL